jgi:hypothetical protein
LRGGPLSKKTPLADDNAAKRARRYFESRREE